MSIAAKAMPVFYIASEDGSMVEYADKIDDAKRKAKNWCSANKKSCFVLVPSFRYDPAEVPVTETDLSAPPSSS